MNKKAQLGEQIMIFAFVFLLAVIGAGIVAGTALFAGGEFDFRGVEANLLSYKIARCISPGVTGGEGFWLDSLKGDDKRNTAILAERCGLSQDVIVKNNFIKICINESRTIDCVSETREERIAFSTGGDFQPCGLVEGERFAGCSATPIGKYVVLVTSGQNIRRVQR